MSDYWFLGGFYNKKRGSLGFLQGSNRYERVIRDVVIIDLIRRVCLYLGVYLVMVLGSVIAGLESDNYIFIAFFPFFDILMGEIEILIARHFDMWNYHYIVVFLGFLVSTPLITKSILLGPDYMPIACVVMAILAAAVAVGIVLYTNKKVRDSYYDK